MTVTATRPVEHGWFTARTGYVPSGNATGIKAVDNEGRIRGMVLFDLWTPASVHMHVALDTPGATKALLRPAFDYVFRQCGKLIALGVVRERHSRIRRFARRLGFHETHSIADGWQAGEDLIGIRMRRQDCRWI